ncbi:hypothetical protein Thermus77838_10380 [Thermus oshimai]
MTLDRALSQVPDPRAHNRRYPLWGLLALILLAFLSRVDSLRGVARFARTHPHLLPHLGLRQALAVVFPGMEGKGKGSWWPTAMPFGEAARARAPRCAWWRPRYGLRP